ncbi:MAG: ABC transporter permease subunit [Clostridia bacterium]|nr:ABC transporter permease subunit [Clostridia bacterium]
MFVRELKSNFKSALIWCLVLVGLFGVVMMAYPYIIDTDQMSMMSEMMDMFPKELLVAFNMDIAMIDTAFGWLKSEGLVMILLILGCYSSMLGANILLKEESDKTIEYLASLPVSRTRIVVTKILVGLIYIVSVTLILGIVNFIALILAGSFDYLQFILLSISPLLPSLCIYFISMFISTFTHKTKYMIGVALGITFVSYLFNVFSTISSSVEFLKYISVFTLADIRGIIINVTLNPVLLAITLVVCGIFAALTCVRYNKKELV